MREAKPSWATRESESFFPTFSDLPSLNKDGAVVMNRGEGPFVFDTSGNRYFDANSGLWNMTLGFSEGRLAAAAAAQYGALPGYHTFFGRNSEPAIGLAERILELTPAPMSRVFFTNSGSEANESVMKLLWLIWAAEGQPQRRKFISRKGAYHGATIFSSSLTGKDYVKAFGLPVPEIVMVGCPHFWRYGLPGESEERFAKRLADELDRTIQLEGPETIAGFFAEPVMGAGGVIVPPVTYFAHIQTVLKKYGIPMVGDEVICGFGRTGHLWGCQTVGQVADIMVASKSISAGYFPMGAVVLSKAVDDRAIAACASWEEFPHGFTTGGHPVGCAISLEAIRIILEEGILNNVRQVSPRFQERLFALNQHDLVGEARGIGLMGALEMVSDKATKKPFDGSVRVGERIASAAREKGFLIRPLGSSVVIAPPFISTLAQIDEMFSVIEETLTSVGADIAKL